MTFVLLTPQVPAATGRSSDVPVIGAGIVGVVIAAGAWSHRLTRTPGENRPLETERGYNTTLPVGAFERKGKA